MSETAEEKERRPAINDDDDDNLAIMDPIIKAALSHSLSTNPEARDAFRFSLRKQLQERQLVAEFRHRLPTKINKDDGEVLLTILYIR